MKYKVLVVGLGKIGMMYNFSAVKIIPIIAMFSDLKKFLNYQVEWILTKKKKNF